MRTVFVTPLAVLLFLAAGGALHWGGNPFAAQWVWLAGLVACGLPVVLRTAMGVLSGRFATDVVATLAIITALLLGQPVAGLVVVLMQTGGEALERYAEGRASRAVHALEQDAPRIAHRIDTAGDSRVTSIPVAEIAVGERLLIRPGEMVPCDARVDGGASHVDTSRITGEPTPTRVGPGAALLSGILNLEGALTVVATAPAAESQYARIVELVRTAQHTRAPLQRLADRYAIWFTPVVLLVCAAAYALTGEWIRVLAVLVVATPCPLILATPVAIIGGVNKAARAHIVVRSGAAMERLASATYAAFDKTGTLTIGAPVVRDVVANDGVPSRELLRLAAGVELRSSHGLARSVVAAAVGAGLDVPHADDVVEDAGRGISGVVDGRRVAVGSRAYVRQGAGHEPAGTGNDPGLRAYVTVDGVHRGAIDFEDAVRPEAAPLIAQLRRLGLGGPILVSGDTEVHVRAMGAALGIADVRGGLLPGEKVAVLQALAQAGERVVMVGDGTNDAPALSAAHVGVALSGHGGGITTEAADVIILGSDLRRVADAVQISRRTLRIARESIRIGLALSITAMGFAAFGHITPIAGALIQEAIDIGVIVNALRASR